MDQLDYGNIATRFLNDRKKKIIFSNERFYSYNNGVYEKCTEEDIKAETGKFFQRQPDLKAELNYKSLNDTLINIKATCHHKVSDALSSWIDGEADRSHISMKNGLFCLEDLHLKSHNPEFFTLNQIPYAYEASASCPTFLRVLNEVLPDPERQDFIQEWFGYHFMGGLQIFVVMYGLGANGKGIITCIMSEFLGDKNICSIGLDQFDSKRTFPLAATVGKLGNICNELSATKTSEHLLKQYVSQETMLIEEKYLPAFNFKPSAPLTFATNELPSFSDRSDGIWRRLIILPFDVRTLDPAKQDKKLKDPLFWRSSGELPGIFNWAIEGYK